MKHNLLLAVILIFSNIVFAQQKRVAVTDREKKIVESFDILKKKSKGALDLNTYQTSLGRVVVSTKSPVTGKVFILNGPPGNLLTAAFRNDQATQLAYQDFYVGNRYGTNYFEIRNSLLENTDNQKLMSQVLIVEPESYDLNGVAASMNSLDLQRFKQAAELFQLRHEELKLNKNGFLNAQSRARHLMIEMYYILNSPESKLATSYKQRGVADDRHELNYYRLWADYLAAFSETEIDYLLQYEFQARSELAPGKKSVSLPAVRLFVAQIYDQLNLYSTQNQFPKAEADAFREIRNTIHNSLNSNVITLLQQFLAKNKDSLDLLVFKKMTEQGELTTRISDEILLLKSQIEKYYIVDSESFVALQKSLMPILPEIKEVITYFNDVSGQKKIIDLNFLQKLALMSTKAKSIFIQTKNIDLIHFIVRSSQVVQQELGKMNIQQSDFSSELIKFKILTQLSAATGLISDLELENILRFMNDQTEISLNLAQAAMTAAITKYSQTFQSALYDWQLVSTSVFKFVEDGLRSTVLIQLDEQVRKMKSQGGIQDQESNQGPEFVVETEGVGYGYLRFIPADQTEKLTMQLTYKDIPIFESMPLDLGVVAGTITELPQTPLSHVNMKSKDRKTPNMYLKKASKLLEINQLINKVVKIEFKKGQYKITASDISEAEAFWLNQKKAIKKFKLKADLNEKRIRSTAELGFLDVISVGAKAANYAEGTHVLPGVFRDGFAVPFYYYDEYIKTNTISDLSPETIYSYIQKISQDLEIKNNRKKLIEALNIIQSRMTSENMKMNTSLVQNLKAIVAQKYPGKKIRFRSSTNSEDMPGFTGAGLYTSEGYNPKHDDPNYIDKDTGLPPTKRKTIEHALKTVWASVFNLRAWDEREYYGLEHIEVKMAMAVTPGYSELANGVGVSKNTIDPKLGEGVYLNIQSDEDAVTNPDPALTPDQVLVLFKPDLVKKTKYTLIYYKYSSKTKTKPVLADEEVEKIADHLRTLHQHFNKLYHPKNDNPDFSLDVEFKVDDIGLDGKKDGIRRVYYKQARPFGG